MARGFETVVILRRNLSNIDKFGLIYSEAGPRSLALGFEPGYVSELDLAKSSLVLQPICQRNYSSMKADAPRCNLLAGRS
jgi:hypothetical protein